MISELDFQIKTYFPNFQVMSDSNVQNCGLCGNNKCTHLTDGSAVEVHLVSRIDQIVDDAGSNDPDAYETERLVRCFDVLAFEVSRYVVDVELVWFLKKKKRPVLYCKVTVN